MYVFGSSGDKELLSLSHTSSVLRTYYMRGGEETTISNRPNPSLHSLDLGLCSLPLQILGFSAHSGRC